VTTAQDGGKFVSHTHWPSLPSRKCSWYSFLLEAESTPGPQCDRKDFMSMKNPLTPAGIEPASLTTVLLRSHCSSKRMQYQLNRGSFESKHNYLILLSLFQLTTCFGLCTGPSSGHKIWGDYTVWIIQCDNMYISIFSQNNYIYFLLCVLQHYMFRPSVWAIIRCVWRLSHTIAWKGEGGWGPRSRYVGFLIM